MDRLRLDHILFFNLSILLLYLYNWLLDDSLSMFWLIYLVASSLRLSNMRYSLWHSLLCNGFSLLFMLN
jgi:hypothetical protein